MEKKRSNGIILVVKIVGVILVFVLAMIAWIWQAAGIAGDVEDNTHDLKEVIPIVDANKARLDKLEIHYDYIKDDTEKIMTIQEEILREIKK